MQKQTPKTQGEAQQYAIDWQQWASTQSLYTSELIEWQGHFIGIASAFDLVEEFEENGII